MQSLKIKLLLLPALLFSCGIACAQTVVDIAGREVDVPNKINKVALGEGRMMYALSILLDDPVEKVVAWRTDLVKNDPDSVRKLATKFPKVKNIADLGDPYTSDVNLESLIKLKPDVYILNIGNLLKAKETGLLDKLAKAGIPTVFIDFRQHQTANTVPSMLILGQVFDRSAKAMKFINFYRQQLALVSNRVSKLKEEQKPLVFLQNGSPGFDPANCCVTYGPQGFGEMIALAGGRNWGSTKTSGFKVKANPEVVFSQNFDALGVTGANWSIYGKEYADAVELGYDATPQAVQGKLQGLANRKGWSELKAMKDKKFYAIFHQFYNSPYHFIAIQAFAKWLHPDLFADVDVEKNYKEFYKEFLPIDFSGVFWAQLK